MEKHIQYPFEVGGGMEDFVVDLHQSSAGGILAVGLISQYGFNGYKPVTCSKEKMPFCQAVIERDSERFGQDLPQLLANNGMGKIIGESQSPGLRGYTVFEFYPEALREINPQVFAEYERSSGLREKAPVSFERTSIKGVEWQLAMREQNGTRHPFTAVALGNSEAPIMVTPEGDSYVLVASGMSPQSYETMDQALDRARELIFALPDQERDAYLAHPTGREGIYQLEGTEYSINAYVSMDYPGMFCTDILETHGLLREGSWESDDMRFDEEWLLSDYHEGHLDIEDCVLQVASELLGEEFPNVEFVAPCNHPIKTVGEYRDVMKRAGERDASLDDLMKEAKEKTAEKNAQKQKAREHKPPELDI